jgi:hypothetical protein
MILIAEDFKEFNSESPSDPNQTVGIKRVNDYQSFHPGDNLSSNLYQTRLPHFLRLGYHVWISEQGASSTYYQIGIRFEPKCLTFLCGEGKNIKDILETLWQKMEAGNIDIDTAVKWLTTSH